MFLDKSLVSGGKHSWSSCEENAFLCGNGNMAYARMPVLVKVFFMVFYNVVPLELFAVVCSWANRWFLVVNIAVLFCTGVPVRRIRFSAGIAWALWAVPFIILWFCTSLVIIVEGIACTEGLTLF